MACILDKIWTALIAIFGIPSLKRSESLWPWKHADEAETNSVERALYANRWWAAN